MTDRRKREHVPARLTAEECDAILEEAAGDFTRAFHDLSGQIDERTIARDTADPGEREAIDRDIAYLRDLLALAIREARAADHPAIDRELRRCLNPTRH